MRPASRLAWILAAALSSCGGGAGGGGPAPAAQPPPGALPPPASDPLFLDLEHHAAALGGLAALLPPLGSPPVVARGASVEEAVLRGLYRAGTRAPSVLCAYGLAATVPARPGACADVLLDVEAERRALDAEEGVLLRQYVAGRDPVRVASMGLLRKGEGPFRFDFRWTWRATRRDRADGSVLLRYDLLDDPAPERVAVFSGLAVIEPDGAGGSRVLESLVLGTRVPLPFFLKSRARDAVASFLRTRAKRLVERMR